MFFTVCFAENNAKTNKNENEMEEKKYIFSFVTGYTTPLQAPTTF